MLISARMRIDSMHSARFKVRMFDTSALDIVLAHAVVLLVKSFR